MRIVEPIVWAYEKVLARLGRLNVADYDAKHRVTPAKMKAALAGRIQEVGIQKAGEPDCEAETVQIPQNIVQVVASLREWKREQDDAKSTPAVIDGDADDNGCPSVYPDNYACEVEGDHDTCSALGGSVTWPRSEMAVSAS